MRPTEVQIAQIDRKRQGRLQDADRVVTVDREVTQGENRPDRAAFPESEWNDAFFGALRSDPLNDEAQAENQAASEADKFPGRERDVKEVGRGGEIRYVHGEGTVGQKSRGEQFFSGRRGERWWPLFNGRKAR